MFQIWPVLIPLMNIGLLWPIWITLIPNIGVGTFLPDRRTKIVGWIWEMLLKWEICKITSWIQMNGVNPLDKITKRIIWFMDIHSRKEGKIFIKKWICNVHIFWEGYNILQNLLRRFVLCTASQIIREYFPNFCGLRRIYEL